MIAALKYLSRRTNEIFESRMRRAALRICGGHIPFFAARRDHPRP